MDAARAVVVLALSAGFPGVLGMHDWSESLQKSAGRGCVYPGKCTPPDTAFSKVVVGPAPGRQFNIDGGFCGSFSTQQNALSVGAYISQDQVRKANRESGGEHYMHGNRTLGYEVVPSNIAETLVGLRLRFDEWDYNSPIPQAPKWKQWIKRHLGNGNPVIFFPMCKGDAHMPYKDSCPNGGHIDHVEAMYGLWSNHRLDDDQVYPDDWIVHTSDQDLEPYYRTIDSLDDTPAMNGNCKHAVAGFGHNEMYPCVDSSVTYGAAILGVDVPGTLPVTLEIDQHHEPNVRLGIAPVEIHGKVTVSGLREQRTYGLFRYNSTESLPSSMAEVDEATRIAQFTATDSKWTFHDPVGFMSNSVVYYLAM